MAFATPLALQPRHHCAKLSSRRSPVATATTKETAATATPNKVEISRHARDLRGYLRAHKSIFNPGTGFLATTITLTRKNDTGRMLIPAVELETNSHVLPGRVSAEYILENNDTLVETAANSVLSTVPNVSEQVAEIIRHDLAYILRVTSYAVAVQATDFVHDNNLAIMRELHNEVGVPTTSFCAALTTMSEQIISAVSDKSTAETTRECFKIVSDALAA